MTPDSPTPATPGDRWTGRLATRRDTHLGIHARHICVNPEVFRFVRQRGLLADKQGVEPQAINLAVPKAIARDPLLPLCDYRFIIGFKSTGDAGQLDGSNERRMWDHGILPLGKGHDEEVGEAVFVLAKGDGRVVDSPFLDTATYNFLLALLGQHSHGRHIVLLFVGDNTVELAIDCFYYQIDLLSLETGTYGQPVLPHDR